MKKQLLILSMVFSGLILFAQWTPVPITGSTADVTAMFTFGEDLMVSTMGDGVFTTSDNGDTWTAINGDLANLNVKDIIGGAGPEVIFVATDDGAFFTLDHSTYQNCTSPPLPTNDLNYFWFGDSNNSNAEFSIGTNGDGIYVAPDYTGPWTAANTGLNGDALNVNAIAGYSDDEVEAAVIATDGGVFISQDGLASWQGINNGLSGDALKVNRIGILSTLIMIVSDGGFYYSIDLGANWIALVPDVKFNDMLIQPSATGIEIFAVGEEVHYSPDFTNWYTLDMTGMSGEVSCVATNATHVFLGTAGSDKAPLSGGMFRKPVDQLITSVPDNVLHLNQISLEQNYPNPCNENTTIKFNLDFQSNVALEVYDVTGKRVMQKQVQASQGVNQITLDVSALNDGFYFYSLIRKGQTLQTRKMIVNH